MKMVYFRQLKILLWKCWIMRRCHYISSIFELLIPLVMSITVALASVMGQRSSQGDLHKPPTIFKTPQLTFDRNGCPSSYRSQFNIWYAPENNFTNSLIKQIQRICNLTQYQPFGTIQELNTKLSLSLENNSHLIGVSFDNEKFNEIPLDFKYTIREFGLMALTINNLFPNKYMPGPAPDSSYLINFSPL